MMAFVVNKINIKYLYHQNKIEWFSNQKVTTADDASYLRPADNLLEIGEWRDNSLGNSSYYQREPGYGFLYLTFKLLFKQYALSALLFFQTLLFGISVFLFGKTIFIITQQTKTALIFQLIYGIIPSSYGFIFYNITEAITPFLMIFFIYFLVKLHKNYKDFYSQLALAILSMIILIFRPQLLPFTFIYPILVIYKLGLNRLTAKTISYYFIIAFSGLFFWNVRGYIISGHVIGLASIYDNTNNTQYRPPHQSFSNLYRIWEYKPEKLHQSLVPIWMNTINNQPNNEDIENAVSILPEYITKIIPLKKWIELFADYQNTISTQKKYFDNQVPMPTKLLPSEILLMSKIDSFSRVLKSKLWWRYYLITPLKSYNKTAIHSNLNLYIFQKTYRGKLLIEVIRWISFLLFTISIFISIWLWVFKLDVLVRLTSFVIFWYTFYLIFFQRMNETRYMHPIYPIALILISYLFFHLKKRISINNLMR
jgi:hypothetical protein